MPNYEMALSRKQSVTAKPIPDVAPVTTNGLRSDGLIHDRILSGPIVPPGHRFCQLFHTFVSNK